MAALGLYAVVLLSDAADGRVARRLGLITRFGAYFDVLADMIVILTLLSVFSFMGHLPTWLPAIPAVIAASFLLSSRRSSPRYDPIGKHYGTLLYLVVGALIWGVAPPVRTGFTAAIVAMSVLVLASRSLTARRFAHP
jgi:phosphatidylglycerophosphate synthase